MRGMGLCEEGHIRIRRLPGIMSGKSEYKKIKTPEQ